MRQAANEGPQADEPEVEREWALYERDREDVEFEDGSSIKWYTNKGVLTLPTKHDNRVVRQLYPTPENCVVVRLLCYRIRVRAFKAYWLLR